MTLFCTSLLLSLNKILYDSAKPTQKTLLFFICRCTRLSVSLQHERKDPVTYRENNTNSTIHTPNSDICNRSNILLPL